MKKYKQFFQVDIFCAQRGIQKWKIGILHEQSNHNITVEYCLNMDLNLIPISVYEPFLRPEEGLKYKLFRF